MASIRTQAKRRKALIRKQWERMVRKYVGSPCRVEYIPEDENDDGCACCNAWRNFRHYRHDHDIDDTRRWVKENYAKEMKL